MGREKTEFHPFCTKRCRLIDLGRWLGEDYRVAEPSMHESLGMDGASEEARATPGETSQWFSFESPYPVADDDDSGHTVH